MFSSLSIFHTRGAFELQLPYLKDKCGPQNIKKQNTQKKGMF